MMCWRSLPGTWPPGHRGSLTEQTSFQSKSPWSKLFVLYGHFSMYRQIGILTGGGDAPGLNAAIRAVVRTAIGEFGMSCIGIEDSFEGILGETHTVKLTTRSVSGILPRGGRILG